MVLTTDLIHLMTDPGGVSHINFDMAISVLDTLNGDLDIMGVIVKYS